jgi:hypothetical protein
MKHSFSLKLLCILLLFSFTSSAIGQVKSGKPRTPKVKKVEKREKQIDDLLDEEKPTKFYVFVGEKIEVNRFVPELKKGRIPFDQAFKAKYKVVQNIYGDYKGEMIEFEAFDHYGFPPFAKYDNVLLFVSEYKGKLYHEKYQYFNVNKTIDGKWASCGDPYRFDDYNRKPIKSIPLKFDAPVFFDTGNLKPIQIQEIYPQPFFVIEENRAKCLMGAYVDDLFVVKKKGVLKARGIF